ncbi:MAG: ferric reductase-like transmembrane domain-containing protein [archaeon]|nr:ferric reductase-like transmembrane domain-containing protein [archaeon]
MTLSARAGSFVFVAAVFLSLLFFYTAYDKETKTLVPQKLLAVIFFSDAAKSWSELNKVAALAAIGLISCALVVGPLSKMFPKTFGKFLLYRKDAGIAGFLFAILHSAYSLFVIYGLDPNKMLFANPKWIGFVAAVLAFGIFFLMAITSTAEAVKKMGYIKWKLLQTTGYVALFFAIVHFLVLEIKPGKGLDVRPYGLVFLALAITALIVRLGFRALKTPPRTAFEEHIGQTPEKDS